MGSGESNGTEVGWDAGSRTKVIHLKLCDIVFRSFTLERVN